MAASTPNKLIDEVQSVVPVHRYPHVFQPEWLWRAIREAEKQVFLDTRKPVARQKVTAVTATDERGINLPSNWLAPVEVRFQEPGDDSLFEGYPVTLVSEKEIDRTYY